MADTRVTNKYSFTSKKCILGLMAVVNIGLTFGFVFNLSFAVAPSVSTGRLALFLMTILYMKNAARHIAEFARNYSVFFAVLIFLIPFSLVWLIVNETADNVMLSRSIWFLVFSIFGSFLFIRMSKFNLITAMSYYLSAVIIQSVLVLISVFNPDFRTWVDQVLVNSGNIDFSGGVRFSGLSNGGGAELSVQLSLGVAAALVIFSQTKNMLLKFFLVFFALVITIATIFVGRTGFYISLIMMMGFIFSSAKSTLISILLVISTSILSPVIVESLGEDVGLQGNDIKLARTVDWAFDIFLTGESSSIDELISQGSGIRELNVSNFLIGSGRITQYDGSNYSRSDSGYIHSIYSLGAPLAIIFYGSLLYVYMSILRPVRGGLKAFGLFFVLLTFILEIKEPFIFKYTLPFFVFVFSYLAGLDFARQRRA